jgi:hypothetical protein
VCLVIQRGAWARIVVYQRGRRKFQMAAEGNVKVAL